MSRARAAGGGAADALATVGVRRARPTADIWMFVLLTAIAVVALLLIWPLAGVLTASVTDNRTGELTLANYQQVLGFPYYLRGLRNSLIVGFGGMAGAILLGLPLAYLTTRYLIRGRDLIATLAVLALVSPPFIGAYAWIMMLGRAGWLRAGFEALGIELPSIYGPFGILLVFSLKFYPFVFLLTAGALGAINRSLEEAAESLGAGVWRRFLTVTLPLVFPAVTSGALLAFVLSLADFGTPSIVGGDFRVLATMAYQLFASEMGGNPGLASTVSIILITVSLTVVALQRWAVRRRHVAGALISRPARQRLTGGRSLLAHLVCYLIVILSSLPSLVVIYTSFRKTSGPVFQPGFGLESYRRILFEVPDVITNSFLFSLTAVALIVVLGTLIGYLLARRENVLTGALDGTLMIPYIVPGVVLGLGFVVAFNRPPLLLTGTALIIILILFIRRLPYAVRSSTAILRQIKGSIEEAAISLGAPPGRAFLRVTLPLMLPGVVAGALLSFITAINELSSTLVLYVGRTMTMPVRIYLSVLDGEFGTAAALSTILLVTTGMAVFIIFRISENKESAFA
ncbi:MAG TPA: iron ABC transporter permease [Geminicoccaceae bacterium]|nr:iron ABC transporter permease [Geminicoccaceae bacterium]